MDVSGIVFYGMRAARFALAVCAAYACGRLIYLKRSGRATDRRGELVRLLCVGYLAALAEIIALRGGMGNTRELRLVPLETTLGTLKAGAWPFIYNFVGNIVWFVPLGWMLRRRGPARAMFAGAAVSLLLEALQWLLMTGVTDVDDVIVNALGALLGALAGRYIFGKWETG